MKMKVLAAAVLSIGTMFASVGNAATYSFLGSWQLGEGPRWTTNPEVLTGQETAALLFGGSANHYAISTVSALVADIDFMTWVDEYAAALPFLGKKVAQDFADGGGNGLYDSPGETTAYVQDHFGFNEQNFGPTNYAFKIEVVPVPASLPLLAFGLGGLGLMARRKRKAD